MSSTRREFLRNSVLAGLGAGLFSTSTGCAGTSAATEVSSGSGDVSATRERASGGVSVHDLTTNPIGKVRVALIGYGQRGGSLLGDMLHTGLATITAVCDLRKDRADAAAAVVEKKAGNKPASYGGEENSWEQLVARDDIDVVVIATPWEWHVPMGVESMKAGKHAFIEVAAAVTVAQSWELVDTSEKTKRHCVMLENCCYGEEELFVLNMTRQGVFGELTHGEAAYIHNLRSMLFRLGTEGDWRRAYHSKIDGNLYPTHGLGPVAQYMGVNRGDRFKYIVSASSPEVGLSKWRDDKKPNDGAHAAEKYICGDMNTSIIKTELGRTIMIQHDIVSPRPYSRINALSGTGATFFGYDERLALDDPKKYGLTSHGGGHGWLSKADLETMQKKFEHPLITKLKQKAAGAGHGGMDFVMLFRHLDCIRQGVTPDSTVYDAAAWSSVIELSARSVANGSAPVAFPDFSRGAWKKLPPLAIVS